MLNCGEGFLTLEILNGENYEGITEESLQWFGSNLADDIDEY